MLTGIRLHDKNKDGVERGRPWSYGCRLSLRQFQLSERHLEGSRGLKSLGCREGVIFLVESTAGSHARAAQAKGQVLSLELGPTSWHSEPQTTSRRVKLESFLYHPVCSSFSILTWPVLLCEGPESRCREWPLVPEMWSPRGLLL